MLHIIEQMKLKCIHLLKVLHFATIHQLTISKKKKKTLIFLGRMLFGSSRDSGMAFRFSVCLTNVILSPPPPF